MAYKFEWWHGLIAIIIIILLINGVQQQSIYKNGFSSESQCLSERSGIINNYAGAYTTECVKITDTINDCWDDECDRDYPDKVGRWNFEYDIDGWDEMSSLEQCRADCIGEGSETPSCIDSDGGDKPNIPGYVMVGGAKLYDYCGEGNDNVHERICIGESSGIVGSDCSDDYGGLCKLDSAGMAYCDIGSCIPHYSGVCDETDGCGGTRETDGIIDDGPDYCKDGKWYAGEEEEPTDCPVPELNIDEIMTWGWDIDECAPKGCHYYDFESDIYEAYTDLDCCDGLVKKKKGTKSFTLFGANIQSVEIGTCEEKTGFDLDICQYMEWAPEVEGIDSCVIGVGICLILIGFIVKLFGRK